MGLIPVVNALSWVSLLVLVGKGEAKEHALL